MVIFKLTLLYMNERGHNHNYSLVLPAKSETALHYARIERKHTLTAHSFIHHVQLSGTTIYNTYAMFKIIHEIISQYIWNACSMAI